MRAFIEAHPGTDALIVSEYNLARPVAKALGAAGRRIPEEVAVAYFDAPSEPLGRPFFTHIRQGEAAMGERALDLLMRQLGGQRVAGAHTLPFELIEGRSTPPAAQTQTRRKRCKGPSGSQSP